MLSSSYTRRLLLLFVCILFMRPLNAEGQDAAHNQQIATKQDIIDIGSRLELFVDPFIINKLINTRRQMHKPIREKPALYFDKEWEGKFSGYVTVLKDTSLYRMYYRGLPVAGRDGGTAEVTAYAESVDGIHWEKPSLGLFKVMNSLENNVVLANTPPFSHNFSPFIDTRPGVPADERYKALGGTEASGLVAFVSADGLEWRKLREEPVLTDGMFDSQNVAFWSEHEGRYICYFRTWTGKGYNGFRSISRATSTDFITWSDATPMAFGDTPFEHLYTNATQPYFRAPHIYLALPNRFFPDKAAFEESEASSLVDNPNYRIASSDAVLMSSRGGTLYDRSFMEAFIPPGPEDRDWVSRNNMPAWGIVPGNDRELFIYRLGHYAQASSHLIRYRLRLDGFVSVRAPYSGGEMITRPFRFKGSELYLNFATSAAGSIKVELQDVSGLPIPGFSLEDAVEMAGDQIKNAVRWKSQKQLESLMGQPVRMRVVMKDADLYSFQFGDEEL